MVERMMGVLRLDRHTFEEVERDQNATVQALIIVVLAAIAGGIGSLAEDDQGPALIAGIINAVLGWAIFAAFAAFVGTRLLETPRTSSNWGEVARVLGFAYTPTLLYVLGFIPILGFIAVVVGWVWWIAASVVGLRQALEMTALRAVGVAIVAFIVWFVVALIIGLIFGITIIGLSAILD